MLLEPEGRKTATLGPFKLEFVVVKHSKNKDHFFSTLTSPMFAAPVFLENAGEEFLFPPSCKVTGQKVTIFCKDFFTILGWRPKPPIMPLGVFIVGF
jgi:hypothetical protein